MLPGNTTRYISFQEGGLYAQIVASYTRESRNRVATSQVDLHGVREVRQTMSQSLIETWRRVSRGYTASPHHADASYIHNAGKAHKSTFQMSPALRVAYSYDDAPYYSEPVSLYGYDYAAAEYLHHQRSIEHTW